MRINGHRLTIGEEANEATISPIASEVVPDRIMFSVTGSAPELTERISRYAFDVQAE